MDKRENLGNDSIHSIRDIDVLLTPYSDIETVLHVGGAKIWIEATSQYRER